MIKSLDYSVHLSLDDEQTAIVDEDDVKSLLNLLIDKYLTPIKSIIASKESFDIEMELGKIYQVTLPDNKIENCILSIQSGRLSFYHLKHLNKSGSFVLFYPVVGVIEPSGSKKVKAKFSRDNVFEIKEIASSISDYYQKYPMTRKKLKDVKIGEQFVFIEGDYKNERFQLRYLESDYFETAIVLVSLESDLNVMSINVFDLEWEVECVD